MLSADEAVECSFVRAASRKIIFIKDWNISAIRQHLHALAFLKWLEWFWDFEYFIFIYFIFIVA